MIRIVFAALLLLAGCAEPLPGSLEACALEKRGDFTLDVSGALPLVRVRLDGVEARLLFDTGANSTVLFAASAERLGVLRNGNQRITTHGIGGKSDSIAANVGKLEIGGAMLPNRVLTVLSFDIGGSPGAAPDGLLGMDVLSQFDVEVYLKAGTGTLYRPRNCPAATPAWPDRWVRLDLPRDLPSGQLQVPVELDGKPGVATVDSGATSTIVATRYAARLGLDEAALAQGRAVTTQGIAPTTSTMRLRKFERLRIGPLGFTAPELAVVELPSAAGDMLIGQSILRNRRMFISLSSRVLFLSVPR